jgi:predicted RNA-binding Zn ribbon-like protein
MEKASSKRRSDWKNGFLFVGNQLALDFLNTRPVICGEPMELLPDMDAVLKWFQAADLLGSREASKLLQEWDGSNRGRIALGNLRAWRERLRLAVVAWEAGDVLPPADLKELNRLMAEHPVLLRLQTAGRGFVPETWFRPRVPEDLFAPIAHSTAMLFVTADRSRVRICGNCILHFLDTSKKGTRRWCSMRLCGNRFKVAAYASRRQKLKAFRFPQ